MSTTTAEKFQSLEKSTAGSSKDWKMVRLGDVCKVLSGFAWRSADFNNSEIGVPVIRINNVDSGRSDFVYWGKCYDSKYLVTSGDMILTLSGSFKVEVWKGQDALLNQRIVKISPNSQVDRDYLFFNLSTQLQWIAEQGNSAIINNVSVKDIYNIQIPLPPLSEQKRIAKILNEQLAAVESARKAAEVQLEATRALPAAYLREVFESEEAKGWEKITLGKILTQRRDVVHPRNKPVGAARFVGLEHIQSGTGIRIGCDEVQKEELTGRKPSFKSGDIVYGYLRPYLNKVWLADFDGLCSVDQYVFQVNSAVHDPVFVSWYMRSPTFLNLAPVDLTPGQLPRIRTEEVNATPIRCPDITTQKLVASRMQNDMENIFKIIRDSEVLLEDVLKFPHSLLRKAFNGEF